MIKEQAKQQQWAADKAIMEEWAAQQEKHEAARKAQVQGDMQQPSTAACTRSCVGTKGSGTLC